MKISFLIILVIFASGFMTQIFNPCSSPVIIFYSFTIFLNEIPFCQKKQKDRKRMVKI